MNKILSVILFVGVVVLGLWLSGNFPGCEESPPPVEKGELVVFSAPAEGGGIHVIPPDTTVGRATFVYDVGTEVTLIAVSTEGWGFDHWVGEDNELDSWDTDTEVENDTTVVMIDDTTKSIAAVFVRVDEDLVRLSIAVAPSDGGIIEADPFSENLFFKRGTEVTVTAVPNGGFSFLRWNGAVEGEKNPSTVLMDEAKSVLAIFRVIPPTVDTVRINLEKEAVITVKKSLLRDVATFDVLNESDVTLWSWVGYSELVNNQNNESFYIRLFDEDEKEFQSTNPNNSGDDFVVADSVDVDGKEVWRVSGTFRLPAGKYSISLWHYIKIADEYPEFKNGEFGANESVHVSKFKLTMKPMKPLTETLPPPHES